MDNPFDQFDPPQANPFDKFDTPDHVHAAVLDSIHPTDKTTVPVYKPGFGDYLDSLVGFGGLESLWNQVSGSVINLPKAPDLSTTGPATNLTDALKQASFLPAAGYNAVIKPLVESIASPLGAATLALPFAPKLVQTAAGLGFTGSMGNATYEQGKQAIQDVQNPDKTTQQKVESVLGTAGSGLMTALAGLGTAHALTPKRISVEAQDGSHFTIDQKAPSVSTDLPASDATKAKLVQLGYDPSRLDNVTEDDAQDVIVKNAKTQAELQRLQISNQQMIAKAAENAQKAAQQPPQQGETPPEVTAQLEQAKKAAQGQAVSELLSNAGKTNITDANANANSIATRPLEAVNPVGATQTPDLLEKAVKPKETVSGGPSYDETVKAKPTEFQKMLKDVGVSEEDARKATENPSDQIPMPAGQAAKIVVKPSTIEGNGVFVTQEVPKGEVLAPALIDGKRTPAGRYTNHSDSPNATMEVKDGQIDLVANRKLNPNEEVTVDYRQAREAAKEVKQKSVDTQQADFDKYQDLQKQYGKLLEEIKTRDLNDPKDLAYINDKMQEIGKQNEEIKNRYGGMPPENPNQNAVQISPSTQVSVRQETGPSQEVGQEVRNQSKEVGLHKTAAPEILGEQLLGRNDPERLAYLQEQVKTGELTPDEYKQYMREAVGDQGDLSTALEKKVNETTPLIELATDDRVVNAVNDSEINSYLEGRDFNAEPPEPPQPPTAQAAGASGQPKNPTYQYKSGLTGAGLGIGKIAEFAKVVLGTIDGNIRAASPYIFGVLRNYEFSKSRLSLDFEQKTLGLSRISRRVFTKFGFEEFSRLLLSGKIDEAKAFATKYTKYGDKLSQAIDNARSALEQAHAMETASRGEGEIGYVENYFPRRLTDYNKFRELMGRDEQGVFDAMIRNAEKRKGERLTDQEKEQVLNSFVSGSIKNIGKPGFLKERTINEIQKNFAQLYEPFDVSLENYLRKVTNDVVNRDYFGRAAEDSATPYSPENGTFGEAIRKEIDNGNLTPKAQRIVEDNLRDRFKQEHQAMGIVAQLGHGIRAAQSAAYLGQITTAVGQFGDVFNSVLYFGPIDTARGYLDRKITLKDIGVHEGNVETAQFSRNKTLVGKATNQVLKFGIGLADQFNKGGQANAILRHFSDVVRKPGSAAFNELNRKYSQQFPDQWGKMLKDIQSSDFRDGKLTPESQFFVFNELADIQPINPSGMAQGYNAAHPLAKAMWGLKSYMIKQMDIMRTQGYEKLKSDDFHVKGQGIAFLAAYAAIAAGAQNFAVSFLRDKLLNRKTDTSDYFVGGLLQPLGLSRYSLFQIGKGDFKGAALDLLFPAASLVNETGHDLLKLRDMLGTRRDAAMQRTVNGLGGLLQQSELVKHFPLIGAEYYSRYGAGAAKERQKARQALMGTAQPTALQSLKGLFVPQDLKTVQRNN